jgi:hypothetical protein
MSRRGEKAKARARRRARLVDISEAERHFIDSDEWAEIVDIACQAAFGHPIREFLRKFNTTGEYYIWPGGHPRCEDIWRIYCLCPQSWFKKELRMIDRDPNHWSNWPCREPSTPETDPRYWDYHEPTEAMLREAFADYEDEPDEQTYIDMLQMQPLLGD